LTTALLLISLSKNRIGILLDSLPRKVLVGSIISLKIFCKLYLIMKYLCNFHKLFCPLFYVMVWLSFHSNSLVCVYPSKSSGIFWTWHNVTVCLHIWWILIVYTIRTRCLPVSSWVTSFKISSVLWNVVHIVILVYNT